jgi:hypothetical protein
MANVTQKVAVRTILRDDLCDPPHIEGGSLAFFFVKTR